MTDEDKLKQDKEAAAIPYNKVMSAVQKKRTQKHISILNVFFGL